MQKLNPSLKHHVLIGFLLSLWMFVFAYVIRPFEHGDMNDLIWVKVSLGFSIVPFLCYVLIAFLQRSMYARMQKWNMGREILIYVVFYSFYTVGTYSYYLSPIVNGFYSFWEFFLKIILPIILIITPVMYLARRYALKLIPEKKEEEVTITGENKLDILKIKQSEWICVSNAQNYVEIFYLENDKLRTKLIRSSLKKLQDEFDFLIKIHRSHLINPKHFKSWKDSNTIELTQIELPVSKSYKSQLLSL